MRLYIQKRKPGIQVGVSPNGTGWLKGGLEMVRILDKAPDEDIETYLLENFGNGEYLVTTHGNRGQLFAVFSGWVGQAGEGGVGA